jgi:hypothetical protein
VERKSGVPATGKNDGAPAATDARVLDRLYANLAPLKGYPASIYVAPATVGTYKQAWARLREGAKGYVTRAWILHNKNVYSFEDPTSGYLSKIVDTG